MAYREPRSPGEPLARFWYGPFLSPARRWLVLLALALALPAAIEISSHGRELTCDAGRCASISHSLLFGKRERAFTAKDVVEVRFVTGLGKSRDGAESVLVFRAGDELRLGRDSEDEARRTHALLARHFRDQPQARLSLTQRPSRFLLVLALVAAGALLAQLVATLRAAWPWRVELWPSRIVLTRPLLGPTRELSIDGARGVAVRDGGTAIETPRGWVRLVERRGAGARADRRVAKRLARELGLAPPSPTAPPSSAAASERRRLPRSVIVLGAVVAVAIAAQLVVPRLVQRDHGTLVLDCRTRCRFQGMECLPGGSVEMSLPAGSHAIEVWAPDAPGGWRPEQIPIRVGERIQFVCRQ